MLITLEILQKRWPHGDQHIPGLIEGIIKASDIVLPKYRVTSSIAVCHFFAQASEECGCGLEMTENMNYSAERLRQVFPTHFTPTMASRAAHNPKQVADIAYGGRMGNDPPPSDDGWNYRGRGLSQVTGKEGYQKLQLFLDKNDAGFNVLDDPDLITSPDYTLECGIADWLLCGCMPFALKDDLVGETKALNGGLNGLVERRRQISLWKQEFKL